MLDEPAFIARTPGRADVMTFNLVLRRPNRKYCHMNRCPFRHIPAGDLSTNQALEDDLVVAILDIHAPARC